MTIRETTSEHGLTVRVQHRRNPYDYLLDDAQLDELLLDLGLRRAASIWRNHIAAPAAAPRDSYPRASMGFVLMDPTVDCRQSDQESVLGVIAIGGAGHTFLTNAAAKAAGHRRLGHNYGEAVLVDPHLCGSGGFRYGHSAEVRGLIVGASSQTTDQDLYEAGRLAAEFVESITARHGAWEERTGPGDWLASDGRGGSDYHEMVSFFTPPIAAAPH